MPRKDKELIQCLKRAAEEIRSGKIRPPRHPLLRYRDARARRHMSSFVPQISLNDTKIRNDSLEFSGLQEPLSPSFYKEGTAEYEEAVRVYQNFFGREYNPSR